MIIVSSLDDAKLAFERHAPAWVISILSEDDSTPKFSELEQNNHLILYVTHDASANTISETAKTRVKKIMEFIGGCDMEKNLLIHCNRGVSRSMAAAYIVLCSKLADEEETKLAAMLRRLAPHADPCPMMTSHADDLLQRNGAMLEAIEDLSLPISEISAPILKLPLDLPSPA